MGSIHSIEEIEKHLDDLIEKIDNCEEDSMDSVNFYKLQKKVIMANSDIFKYKKSNQASDTSQCDRLLSKSNTALKSLTEKILRHHESGKRKFTRVRKNNKVLLDELDTRIGNLEDDIKKCDFKANVSQREILNAMRKIFCVDLESIVTQNGSEEELNKNKLLKRLDVCQQQLDPIDDSDFSDSDDEHLANPYQPSDYTVLTKNRIEPVIQNRDTSEQNFYHNNLRESRALIVPASNHTENGAIQIIKEEKKDNIKFNSILPDTGLKSLVTFSTSPKNESLKGNNNLTPKIIVEQMSKPCRNSKIKPPVIARSYSNTEKLNNATITKPPIPARPSSLIITPNSRNPDNSKTACATKNTKPLNRSSSCAEQSMRTIDTQISAEPNRINPPIPVQTNNAFSTSNKGQVVRPRCNSVPIQSTCYKIPFPEKHVKPPVPAPPQIKRFLGNINNEKVPQGKRKTRRKTVTFSEDNNEIIEIDQPDNNEEENAQDNYSDNDSDVEEELDRNTHAESQNKEQEMFESDTESLDEYTVAINLRAVKS